MDYTILYEEADGILVCRIESFIDNTAAAGLAGDWRAALISARTHRTRLRVLFDNRSGTVMSPTSATLIRDKTRDLARHGDKFAVLVSGDLPRIQAKRTAGQGSEIFNSEETARAWLLG